jgi:hypothetical protein
MASVARRKNPRRLNSPVRKSGCIADEVVLHRGQTVGCSQSGAKLFGDRGLAKEVIGTSVESPDKDAMIVRGRH